MIRIATSELDRFELRTRLPFKYGIATMTELPHVFLRVTAEIDGHVQTGIAADHLPPKWFTKDPTRNPVEEIDEMVRVIRQAMRLAEGLAGPSVFALWRELQARQSAWAAAGKIPPLLAQFGTSLIERAVLDAFARRRVIPLHRLLRDDALGLELGALHPELAGTRPRDWLSAAPLAKVIARHTVGLADPLTEADISPADRLADGLPQSLEDCVRVYGLKHFKIKITGRRDADFGRLEKLAALLARHAPADYAFSLDGNECFSSLASFREFWREAVQRPTLADFARHLLFVEQPLHRDVALHANVGVDATAWPDRPPIIIDESDAELDSLSRALELGYAGTSHKNCKGVFKGIANACRIAQLRRAQPETRFIMSGEDLANIGPVALLQDLAVQAALGIASVERNGHHYFAGLSFWPSDLQAAMLAHHGDLYTRSEKGWPRIAINVGELALGSVNAAPFGVGLLPFTP
ncbi:MAG: hypothetical protein ACREIA_22315 [Opitutaceae bacterium]